MYKNKKIIGCGILLVSILTLSKIAFNSDSKIEQLEILNVDKINDVEYKKEDIIDERKFAHLSFDDFIEVFEDITYNADKYSSIFENDTLNYFKMLHDRYGTVISCYVYYENDDSSFNLSYCTDKFKEEFKENIDWLKFGFNTKKGSKNYQKENKYDAKNDYEKVIGELIRITGTEESIDRVVRLQNFAGNNKSIEAMANSRLGIQGLLGADDRRRSYYLNNELNSYLYTYDYYVNDLGLNFFKTDLRMESIDNIEDILNEININDKYKENKDILIAFTHEWRLDEEGIKDKIERFCEFVIKNDYIFEYPMNRLT